MDAGGAADLLIVAVAWYTTSRFPGFVNARTSPTSSSSPSRWRGGDRQTHALLVGYLDLSVGAMVTFGVVIASFLIGPDASGTEILIGVGAFFLAALALGLVNAGLVLGVKIPSIIATLATLSILNGISLTLRAAPGGRHQRPVHVVARDGARAGPDRVHRRPGGRGALDYGSTPEAPGLQPRSVGFDERSAKRGGVRTNWVRGGRWCCRPVRRPRLLLRHDPVRDRERAIGDSYALKSITAAVLGGAALSGGSATFLGAVVASVLLALILTVLPFLGLTGEYGLIDHRRARPARDRPVPGGGHQGAREAELQAGPPPGHREPAAEGRRDPRPVSPGTDFSVPPTGRTLIRGGTVLSLDPELGDLDQGDVLIEGDRILAVGPDLSNGEVEVIDASGMIVMPGFVDSHRHIWEGLLRNIGTDVPLEGRTSYISFVLHKLAPAFRPEDAYVGNLVSALGAIDAGITTLLDWSHIQGSPAHTDAVIQALKDSGLRAVFAYGFPWWGKWEERQPSWFVRPPPSTSPRRTRSSRSRSRRPARSSPTSR